MDHTIFSGIKYSQQLQTCVLASYAVACFPFTRTPVVDYFLAYCRHFTLDETHPERSYEGHFIPVSRTTPGYQILRDIHCSSKEPAFAKARESVTLDPVNLANTDTAGVELAIRQPDCLLLLFVNASGVPGLSMHSIVVGHDGRHFYYFDTVPGALLLYRHRVGAVADFGHLGDAFIVRKKH
jgi:hypothetical protein